MDNKEEKNENLEDKTITHSAEATNMPNQLVPRFHSDKNTDKNKVKSDAEFLGKNFGGGDFGSEEARQDTEKGNKGNKGHAGNQPYSEDK